MKISRSTRKILIVFLVIILIVLLILLYVISKKEKISKSFIIYNNNVQSSGVVEEVENPFDGDDEKKSTTTMTVSDEIVKLSEQAVQAQADNMEVLEEPSVVYDNKTLEQLAEQINKSLNSDLSGKGYLYASYSLEKGVDPYLAVAISLEETGCTWECSNLVKSCNNVGGMKGSGCGAYGYFNTLDDGIRAFIDNISRNYVAYGLTTAELMNPKYAENPNWASNVNAYIERIKIK